jgi:hypothetical protein
MFFLAQAHHERELQNDELKRFVAPVYFRVLQVSTLLAIVTGVGLLIYCFIRMAWYWPLILICVGAPMGAAAFGFASTRRRLDHLSKMGFVMLPLSAVWAVYNIATP